MGIFGWSYPAGAENDPNAPYNQDYDDSEEDEIDEYEGELKEDLDKARAELLGD